MKRANISSATQQPRQPLAVDQRRLPHGREDRTWLRSIEKLVASLRLELIAAFHAKGEEFSGIIKMGRTQLQDAVPMTLGQEFEAYAADLTEETERLTANMKLFFEINMGATAIGTGINADPDYAGLCTRYLREITGLPLVEASTIMIEATSDTGAFIMNSSAQKRLAVKLSKICNDLRLLSSGPRCGLNEINLPPRQPGCRRSCRARSTP